MKIKSNGACGKISGGFLDIVLFLLELELQINLKDQKNYLKKID